MIGVIGSGSWATAIVKILLEHEGCAVAWWVRGDEVARGLQRKGRNPHHLSALCFNPARLWVSTDVAAVVERCSLLVLAVPSAYAAATLAAVPEALWQGKRVASAVKGYLPESECSVSHYLEHVLHLPPEAVCVVSGPSHAEEVAAGQCTFLEAASVNPELAAEVADALRCSYVHTAVGNNVESLELCGLCKNVYAVCAGMAVGMGQGDNLCAALTAAAAREMQTLTHITAPTFATLGDLMVTCFSRHSRNRALGEAVVAGIAPDEHFRRTGMVAEGYFSARALHLMPKPQPTPMAEAVYRVLHCGTDPVAEMEQLIDTVF